MPSSWDRRSILDPLKQEIATLKTSGLRPFFRSGALCLGAQGEVETSTCLGCALLDFVPQAHKDAASPCHRIPLNGQGETIDSLSESADPARLEAEIVAWMERTAVELERELGQAGAPPPTSPSPPWTFPADAA